MPVVVIVFEIVAALALTIWGALALHVRAPGGRSTARALVALWIISGGFFIATRFPPLAATLRFEGTVLFGAAVIALFGWWCSLRPSHEREWIPEVARLMSARLDGRIATVSNVRRFVWHSREDGDEHWETRRYDLDALDSVDLLLSSWGRPAVAHVMVSFGFTDGAHLVFSVEIRRKRGDRFSELGGFFRQYERCIVAADEEDIVKVRTNVRGEEGELFRLNMPHAMRVSLFKAYLDEANRLLERPRFYNTVTANCTTLVYQMARRLGPRLPLDYRLLATGHLPEYLLRIGALRGADDVASYRRLGRFTERARESTGDFSRDIRVGVPGVDLSKAPNAGAADGVPPRPAE